MSGPQAWAAPGSALPPGNGPARPTGATPPADPGNGRPEAFRPDAADRADLLGGDIAFRPLGISEILDGAITCIRRQPRTVLGLSVAICGVIQVLNSLGAYFFIGRQANDEVTPEPVLSSVGTQFTLAVLGLMMSAYGTLLLAGLLSPVLSRTIFDQPVSLRQAWQDTRPQLARLIGTAAVVMTLSLAGLVVPILPLVLAVAADAPAGVGVLAGLVGVPLGLAIMVWLYVLWVLAVPAVVLEKQTVWGALRRAYQLSRRRWWRTCGTLLLALVITIFMGFLALRVPFLVAQLIIFGDSPSDSALVGSLAIDTLGRIISWSLVTPFDAGVIALLYIDRRMRREGFDLDVLTRRGSGAEDDAADHLGVWRPVEFPPAAPLPPPPPRGRHVPPGAPPYAMPPYGPQPAYPPPGPPQAPTPQGPYGTTQHGPYGTPQGPTPQGPYGTPHAQPHHAQPQAPLGPSGQSQDGRMAR